MGEISKACVSSGAGAERNKPPGGLWRVTAGVRHPHNYSKNKKDPLPLTLKNFQKNKKEPPDMLESIFTIINLIAKIICGILMCVWFVKFFFGNKDEIKTLYFGIGAMLLYVVLI